MTNLGIQAVPARVHAAASPKQVDGAPPPRLPADLTFWLRKRGFGPDESAELRRSVTGR